MPKKRGRPDLTTRNLPPIKRLEADVAKLKKTVNQLRPRVDLIEQRVKASEMAGRRVRKLAP